MKGQVAAGAAYTVGLKSDDTVVAVGLNDEGERDIGDWTGITQVATGAFHTVAIKSKGTIEDIGLASTNFRVD